MAFLAESGYYSPYTGGTIGSKGVDASPSITTTAGASTTAQATPSSLPPQSSIATLNFSSVPYFTHAQVQLYNNHECTMGKMDLQVGSTMLTLENDQQYEIVIRRRSSIGLADSVAEQSSERRRRGLAACTVFRDPFLCNHIATYIEPYSPNNIGYEVQQPAAEAIE